MSTDNAVVDPNNVPASHEMPDDPNFDYDKEWAAQVAKRAAEKAGNNGEQQESSPTEPAAEVVETPQTEAVETTATETTEGEGKKDVTPAPVVDEKKAPTRDEIIAALPEGSREAAKAAFAESDARIAALEHDNRSQAGRVAAFQRKYEEAAGKKPAEVVKAATDEQQEKWNTFKANYPEVSEAMEALVAAKQPGVPPNVTQMAEFVENEMRTRFLTEASAAVDAVHPGFAEVTRTTAFKTWQASNPTYDRLASSDDVTDAIALMDLWKASRPAAPAAPVVDPKLAADAKALAARRDAQVEGGKAAATTTANPNPNVDLNDPDQMWNFYASKSNSRMKKRNAQ